jgi:hypothetical protein
MMYTIKEGDTLESIAKKLYGDESMSQYLASINGIPMLADRGSLYYAIWPGDQIETGVAEVVKKKYPWGWVITAIVVILIVIGVTISKKS